MEFISTNLLIIIGVIIVFIVLFLLAMSKQYHKAGPNEALIISGGRIHKVKDPDGTVKKIGIVGTRGLFGLSLPHDSSC